MSMPSCVREYAAMAKKTSPIRANRTPKGQAKLSTVRRAQTTQLQDLPSAFENLTKYKQAEETWELFRVFLDQADASIEIINPATGRFLDPNEKPFSSLGYTRQEH